MSGGSTIIGPWPKQAASSAETELDGAAPPADPSSVPPEIDDDGDDYAAPRRDWGRILLASVLLILAAAWTGIAGFTHYSALSGRAPLLADVTQFLTTLAAPLILMTVVWMAFSRTGRSEERRFSRTIDKLKSEEVRLNTVLAEISRRISESRAAITLESQSLMELGGEASERLSQVAEAMRGEVEGITRQSNTLKFSASAARADMAVLLTDMPKAQLQTRQMVTALQEAGMAAQDQTAALDTMLSSLVQRGQEADAIATGAAQSLAVNIERIENMSDSAVTRLDQASELIAQAVDTTLARADTALSSARQDIEAQGVSLLAMVEQSQETMAIAGQDSAQAIQNRVSAIADQVALITNMFAEQDMTSRTILDTLSRDIATIEQRFAALGEGGNAAAELASESVKALMVRADQLNQSLDTGGKTAGSLIAQAETLLTALDASARELDETLPAAYARLEKAADNSRKTAEAALPDVLAMREASQLALEQLREAGQIVQTQQSGIETMATSAETLLSSSQTHASALLACLDALEQRTWSLTETAGPKLVDALAKVKEAATAAADHAQSAMADIIPKTAQSLGDKTRDALNAALSQQVEEQMVEIARTAENAVGAAQLATDRLMRQMLTISETSAALELRIAEAKEDVERSDDTSFARRVALLIESLNSTAIDVTKILSNEVTDTAWAAYLRGDRGVFTRRAVKLLDAGEVREVARFYEEEIEFRDQVNRYIHDFEAMLRNVLATRDGSPLSVTLLSSDAGKLYVALAQAIERLRT